MEDNIFKKLEHDESLPDEVKAEVLERIESFKLIADLAGLFGTKYLDVVEDFLKRKK